MNYLYDSCIHKYTKQPRPYVELAQMGGRRLNHVAQGQVKFSCKERHFKIADDTTVSGIRPLEL